MFRAIGDDDDGAEYARDIVSGQEEKGSHGRLTCVLPGLHSMAVHLGAGARTVPQRHHGGQHLVFVEGVGVVADEDGVRVVRAGDVLSNPPDAGHWHGATSNSAATHVTFETPGHFDLDFGQRHWDDTYPPDLGT